MEKTYLSLLAELRILVGYLGEQGQFAWWQSAFFSASSRAFLTPVFAKTAFLAQCQGAKEAAGRVHDEHIGVGNVYHLFRLPEGIEQELHRLLHQLDLGARLSEKVKDREKAVASLREFNGKDLELAEGPVRLGSIDSLRRPKTWQTAATYYGLAFENDARVYPYLTGEK